MGNRRRFVVSSVSRTQAGVAYSSRPTLKIVCTRATLAYATAARHAPERGDDRSAGRGQFLQATLAHAQKIGGTRAP